MSELRPVVMRVVCGIHVQTEDQAAAYARVEQFARYLAARKAEGHPALDGIDFILGPESQTQIYEAGGDVRREPAPPRPLPAGAVVVPEGRP